MTNINHKIIFIAAIFLTFSVNVFANDIDITTLIKNSSVNNTNAFNSTGGRTKLTPIPVGLAGDNNRYGYSISISGNTAVVGAPNMGTTGLAYVYDYDGTDWNQTVVLKPSENLDMSSLFGISVSMDNNRIVVGASQSLNLSGSTSGSAHVFDLIGGQWVQTQKLIINDGWSNDNFGHSVSLENNRVAICAYRAVGISNYLSGVVYIYDLISGNWTESQKISPEDGMPSDYFGFSVDLSESRLIIGAYRGDDIDFSNSGSAYIYDLENSSWILTQKLTASTVNKDDYFGYSVSLNGNQALIGASGNDLSSEDAGAAYVFDYDGNNWIQSTILHPSSNSPSSFGSSVKLHSNQAIIGAYNHSFDDVDSGATFIFELNNEQWQQSQIILPEDRESQDYFGQTVSAFDRHLFINAMYDDENGINSGSVYTYKYNNGTWITDYKIDASETVGSSRDSFGISVSFNGKRLVVGAHLDDGKYQNSGAAYICDLIDNSWVLTQKITPNNEIANSYFGKSVSLYGNRVLIGAPGGIIRSTDRMGTAYIFDLIEGTWTQTQNISASNEQPDNKFGYSVSLFEDRALIGAYGPYGPGFDHGSAYIYDLIQNTWTESQILTATSDTYSGDFGVSVRLHNDRALIGSQDDYNYSNKLGLFRDGAAYVFDLIDNEWQQTQKLFDPTRLEYSRVFAKFGSSVSLFNDRVAIGAPSDVYHENSGYGGSAYIFEYDGTEWILKKKMRGINLTSNDIYGISISLFNNKVAVGASRNSFINDLQGSVFVYEYNDNNWSQLLKIKPTNGNKYDYFGTSVSLFEDNVFIGANGDDNDSGKNAGAVYLFEAHELIFNDGFE